MLFILCYNTICPYLGKSQFMNISINSYQENEKFTLLRNHVEQKRIKRIDQRLARNPSPTPSETKIGAFMEMYEPHLLPIIHVLIKKGYRIDPTSGFCGEYFNCQTLNGSFPIDYILANKLIRFGFKMQSDTNTKSIRFWPDKPDLSLILEKYTKIAQTLPQRSEPSRSYDAQKFRMTYVPKNIKLKRTRLFEILKFKLLKQVSQDTKKRLKQKPIPSAVELRLGAFIEMIEPQLREALLTLNRKGYTTDSSGFLDKTDTQIIDGDFTIDKTTILRLKADGIKVETNPSGYTRLQFTPLQATINHIRDRWLHIATLLPDQGKSADPSMTQKARQFRLKFG